MSKSRLALFVAFCCVAFYGCSQNSPKGIDVSHHQGDINWNKVAKEPIGFVYINKEIQSKIHPIIFGTQQKGLRGGTENVPYIAALATAAKKTMDNFPSTHLTW